MRDWDESDYRPRPNPRGSRPRTKRRPDYSDAPEATIVTVGRGRLIGVLDEDGREVVCVRASRLRRTAIVPGDRVKLTGDISGSDGTMARIVEILPRTTLLRRSADDGDTSERVLVANADLVAIVTAAADPEPRPRLIDRALTAAFDAGMEAVIVVTKTDLATAEPLRELYRVIDVPVLETRTEPGTSDQLQNPPEVHGVEALREKLAGRTTVLLGHSGVGKSTLINALVPEAGRATGSVNEVTGRGRHTSSSAIMLPLPGDTGGWAIDTPGIRSFGLAHVSPESLLAAFPDLAPAAAQCPKACLHQEDSAGCRLDEWVASGEAGERGPARLRSYRRLLASIAAGAVR